MLTALRTNLKAYLRPLPLDPARYFFKKSVTAEIISIQLDKRFPPVFLRKNSTDVNVFNDVFHRREYDINFYGEPKVIIDCGANIGLTSVYFAQRFPNATIISVEPERKNFEMLQKNASGYKNIHALNYGIWNKATSLEVIDRGEGAWAFVVNEVPKNTQGAIEAISISAIKQQFNLEKIDVLKIDIEGSEKELFEKGTADWLPFVKTMVLELHDVVKKGCTASLINALQPFDYSLEPFCESIVVRLNH